MGKVQKNDWDGTEDRKSRHDKNDGHCTDDQKKSHSPRILGFIWQKIY